MKCPKCQYDNREKAKFCIECGNKLERSCPECKKPLPPEAKFCDECGHHLQKTEQVPTLDFSHPHSYTPKFLADKILTSRSSLEGERKLVTVLFADVADFTSLSEKLDPEEVHQIMDGCFKILMEEIHKYEGTINQFTGDGVMALFGAPIAHEDHAQRACHAAISIQQSLETYHEKIKKDYGADFKMRIGLNSGPVIVGAIGDDLRMDYTAVGDISNLAARMESTAYPDTILVSKNTYKIAREFFEFEPQGNLTVKGKENPQEAFKLLKKGGVDTRIDASVARGLTRFVGRKNSMGYLMEAYEKVKFSSGQVIGIVGEAGVGKSRLVLEFIKQLPEDEFTFLSGECLHYGGAMAYLPVLDILKSYFDISDDDREFIIRKKIEEKIHTLDETLTSVFTPFHDLLSLKVDDESYLQVEPSEKKMRIFESLRNLLFRQSQNRPLILIIDDLHWIDKISEEFLNYFIGWLQNTRIMLILLYRPEYTHQWGNKSYYAKVGLTQLGNTSSSQLVQSILEDGEVAPKIRELILKKAGGNPLFVEELTHNLLENGAIEIKNHKYVLAEQASDIEIPDTIQGIIAARIDRIEESLKQVMQVASVIGREFAFRILDSIMGMKDGLKKYLLNLQGLEFISEKQLFPELEYIFKHALTQEVAYNSLLQKRKKEIHEKVANAIEALYPDRIEEYYELLAHHYRRSDNKKRALDYLELANEKARNLNAPQEAMNYFNEAMQFFDAMDNTPENQYRRISLIADQAYVFTLLLKYSEYYDLLKQHESMAIDLSDNELLARLYSSFAVCEIFFGRCDQAIATGTKAIKLSKEAGSPESAYNTCFPLLMAYWVTGRYENIHTLKIYLQSLWEKKFNLRLYILTFRCVGLAYIDIGRIDRALETSHEALKIAEKFSDNNLVSLMHSMIAIAYSVKGDMKKGIEHGELSIQKSQTPGDELIAKSIYAWVLCRAGDPKKGTDILAAYHAIFKDEPFLFYFVANCTWLGEGYFLAEEYDKAIQLLKNGLTIAEQCNMKPHLGRMYYFLGEIALKTDPQQAPIYFEKSTAVLQEIKAEVYLAKTFAGYGRYYKKQGDGIQAREYLTKALKIFDRLEILDEPDKVKEELADLPGYAVKDLIDRDKNEMPEMPAR